MILDPLDIPDDLLEAQEGGRLVVFAGAGVSRGAPSDLPDFRGLAAWVARGTQFERELSPQEQHRLDRYFGEMARADVQIERLVRARIGDPASRPTDLHRWIIDLFPQPKDIRIVTTNFDTHFSRVLSERKLQCDQYFAPALPLGRKFRGIVYLHGSVLRADDPLILSDEDFGRAYMIEAWARDFLRGMFDCYTTLFVGYSHTDPPVEYLARGMSAIHVAPRYALASEDEEPWWNSLKVGTIPFNKPGGDADFSELRRGLHAWAQFSKDQPTDTAQKVRDILRSPPTMKPAQSQSSLLVRCLGRKDECHFFTSEAAGWHWVEWAIEQGVLKPLFAPTTRELTEPQRHLAWWLAKILVTEPTDRGLLLIAQHGGTVSRELWLSLCRNLWPHSNPDFASPVIQQWVLLLVSTCPPGNTSELGHFLGAAAKAAPKILGLLLFRFLTNIRVTASSGWTFDVQAIPGEFTTRPKAELELTIACESHHLEDAWDKVFKPLIPEFGRDLLRILNDRLNEMYRMLRAAQNADARRDPWSARGSILERDAYRRHYDHTLILDFLLDVVEAMSQQPSGLPSSLVEEWLTSEPPTLVRVGLLSLQLSKIHTAKQKLQLLLNHALLYPLAWGAEQEAWAVLLPCYPELAPEDRAELWRHINQGPTYPAPEGVNAQEWSKHCRREIDKLTERLASPNPQCPQAAAALQKLMERYPDRREPHMVTPEVEPGRVIEMGKSPKSAAELLSQAIDTQIEFLLTYQGEAWPSGVTRDGLVAAVGEACAQNPQWAISLFEELARRQNWTTDLWQGAFWRLPFSAVPPDKLAWLLDVLDRHFGTSPDLQGLTFFLLRGVEFTAEKAPPREIVETLIRISSHIWRQLRTAEAPKTTEYEKTQWTNHAINHAAGHVVEFWLKCWSFLRSQSPDAAGGWPDWLRAPLQDMIDGSSYAAQLGRAILGNSMPFVHAIDPGWARANLLPKFNFANAGEEAFILWEGHLKYGRLSRDLIIEMLPLYRQAFPRFRAVDREFAVQLYRHVTVIIYSCLVDVNQDGWLKEFLLGLTEDQRAAWANQLEFIIRDFPDDRKKLIWEKWMKDYWKARLDGKPCKLASKEAGEMLECALSLGPEFPAAVDLALAGPPVRNRIGAVLFHLERGTLLQAHPETVVRLLKWLLTNSQEDWLAGDEVHKVVMQIPKRKAFLPDLLAICDQLARRGYPKAVEMKIDVQRIFVED